jgi:hypothetical protein
MTKQLCVTLCIDDELYEDNYPLDTTWAWNGSFLDLINNGNIIARYNASFVVSVRITKVDS